jgi:hypothetical protein
MDHGMQQLASAGPENLDAEAKQNEGREPHGDIGATGSQQALDAVGVGKTHENGDSNHENGANGGKHQHDLIGRTRIGAPGQSETDDDRDGPGPGRKRQSQRMEGLIERTGQRPFLLRGFQVLLATLAQQLPSGNGDDEAAGDAKDRY